jgi:hypothetical protein
VERVSYKVYGKREELSREQMSWRLHRGSSKGLKCSRGARWARGLATQTQSGIHLSPCDTVHPRPPNRHQHNKWGQEEGELCLGASFTLCCVKIAVGEGESASSTTS